MMQKTLAVFFAAVMIPGLGAASGLAQTQRGEISISQGPPQKVPLKGEEFVAPERPRSAEEQSRRLLAYRGTKINVQAEVDGANLALQKKVTGYLAKADFKPQDRR